MQKDSVPVSTSGPVMHNQAVAQESLKKAFHCSHCTLVFKSKVYLFEHLNKVHGFTVDTALVQSGLKQSGIKNANLDDNSNGSGNVFLCQHCDFKAGHWDVLNEHEKRCQEKAENQNNIGNLYISENPETKITVTSTNQHIDDAEAKRTSPFFSVTSTSNAECTLKSSKDLKTHKRPLQTITKYFTALSGSKWKSPGTLSDSPMQLDSTKETLILQESLSSSSPKSSGVFKVTAKSLIDIPRNSTHQTTLNDHIVITDVKSYNPKEEFAPEDAGKRTSSESSAGPLAKKAKPCEEETKSTNASKQLSLLEVAEDDDEDIPVNGDTENPNVYLCKHCDYSNVSIINVSTHYQSDHPCVRYNTVYIQDPCDQSATFRCLECPVEFLSVDDLKGHYMENHPEAPDVFNMQSRELGLVFKCFACQFTTNILKTLKQHYKEMHPTHKADNSLLYCRYSVTRSQETSSQLNTCKKESSPGRSEGKSPKSACAPCKEVKNVPSPERPNSRGTDVALYRCNNCDFSHKSVIVMHVHYQKSHPNESITIDKIKQLHAASQKTPEKPPNSVRVVENCRLQKSTSESSEKGTNKADVSHQRSLMNLKQTQEASTSHLESHKLRKRESAESRSITRRSLIKEHQKMSTATDSSPDKVFYCQFCSYSNTKVKSVVGHHYAKHVCEGPTCAEEVLVYSTELQKRRLQSEVKTTGSAPSSDSKQVDVHDREEHQRKEDASVVASNPYQCAEKLFYCQKCNFGNPSVKGVLNHQSKTHRSLSSNRECILEHTALTRKEIEQANCHTKELTFGTRLPLPLMNEGDEYRFFCHFCNYRHSTIETVLRHYFKHHHGFEDKSKYIHLYTSLVLEQMQKLYQRTAENKDSNHAATGNKQYKKKKKKKLDKCLSVLASSSLRASQTQRILQCHRCTYVTQFVYNLKIHMRKIHKSNRSSSDVLRVCFKQGNLQSGYHCDLCVFSDKNATAVYKHYQEKHPDCKLSLEYIISRLYVGPDASTKRKKLKMRRIDSVRDGDGTDSNATPQRDGEKETKTFSCKACLFKGHSMSDIEHHYCAVHPWSVKEDGSVLDGIVSKKQSTNSPLKDQKHIPESFDTYQIPLEFDQFPDSPHEATSATEFNCTYCAMTFSTERSLKIHRGMKHQEAIAETSDEHQDQQSQKRVHVFKCPHCSYINNNYQGVLTHCQMRHPVLEARADSLHLDKKRLQCLKNSAADRSRYRGYMCKTCQQVYATVEKMNRHYEKEHKDKTKPSTIKMDRPNTYSAQGSVSKASFLSKKIYAVVRCKHCSYTCSTKIALSRHMLVHHRNIAVSKAKDCIPVYNQVKSETSVPTSLAESTSQACKSSARTNENKIRVYKCPACSYVNASYHGTLTHCQMMHPDLIVRADELQTDEILVTNMINCKVGKGSNERGYTCSKCPQIHPSPLKLKIHSERVHDKAERAASDHLEKNRVAALKCITSASSTSKTQNKDSPYKCHICPYAGSCRKYLYTHYKFTHKLDAFSMHKLLEKYNKHKSKFHNPTEAQFNDSGPIKCKKCPDLTFDSLQLLVTHYSTIHKSVDFTVLFQRSVKSMGVYKCDHCNRTIDGITNLSCHLDRHRAKNIKKMRAAEKALEAKPSETLPTELESGENKYTCKQCRRTFMSLKGLLSHERSHAAFAAIKKMDSLPTSASKHNINQYVVYKSGNLRPFLCSICSYRTTVLGLWKRHFMRNHKDVLINPGETNNQEEDWGQTTDQESFCPTEESDGLSELDEKPDKKSLYLEPPDVQRQLTHYSSMTQIGVSSKANLQENLFPENSLLHCELCNFNSGHVSSIRRHYLNRHGKKILRCKDCNFFTGIRKTLEMHLETGHSTFQSEPTHQKDLRCPFCLYQTKNKNNMIDHIVLHREERVVPIEVRRAKLSRYLQGIVFRCHKCTFTSGSAENLHVHMTRHNDIKPYRCRLCYFDSTELSNLEAHLTDKHQVVRNHELVGQVSLDQLGAIIVKMREEVESPEQHNVDCDDEEMQADIGEQSLQRMNEAEEKNEQEEQQRDLFLRHTAGEQQTKNVKTKNEVVTVEDFSGLERQRGNQSQHKPTDDEDLKFTPLQEEEAEWSSLAHGENLDMSKLHQIKAPDHKINIESRVKELDDSDQDATVRIEQSNEVVDKDLGEIQLDEKGSFSLTHNIKHPVKMDEVSLLEKKNHKQTNDISLEVEKELVTSVPSCAQLKTSHKGNLGVSFANCKEEVQCKKNSEEETDSELEKTFCKEEMCPLECRKEVEDTDGLERSQDEKDEMLTEGEKQCNEERCRIKEAGSPPVHRGSSTGGAAEVLTEEQRYSCQFCGRNFFNSLELTRHVMRHGI